MRKFLLFPLFFLVMGLILCCTSRQDSFNYNLSEGLKFMEEGNWNEAVKTFDLCVKEKPAFSVGYFFRSDAYYMKGAYEEALADIIMAAEFGMILLEFLNIPCIFTEARFTSIWICITRL